MYIKRLELSNFQVIEKFEGKFEGNVYFVTGDNELGKSTLLKAIGIMLTITRSNSLAPILLKRLEFQNRLKLVI